MKVVIVNENCDTKLLLTIQLLEFIYANRQSLACLKVELIDPRGKSGAPTDHFLMAGKTAVHGHANIINFLSDYIGKP